MWLWRRAPIGNYRRRVSQILHVSRFLTGSFRYHAGTLNHIVEDSAPDKSDFAHMEDSLDTSFCSNVAHNISISWPQVEFNPRNRLHLDPVQSHCQQRIPKFKSTLGYNNDILP